MKKTVFTKITTDVMMLVLFVALAVGLSVASAAEVQAQVQWSADATSEPIGSGTLQEAFDAAAAENSTVGYIRVLSDIDLGDENVRASGGAFTLDLNGKTVTSTTYTVYLENAVDVIITDTSSEKSGRLESTNSGCAAIVVNDDTAVDITVEGGTVEGGAYAIMLSNGLYQPTAATLTVSSGKLIAGSSVIEASGASVTVSGGEFESAQANIDWISGVVDLSAHPAPEGITVCNYTDIDVVIPSENIKLPAGYGFYFYDEWVNTLAMNYIFTIDLIWHNVSLSVGANGQATLSPEGERLAQNTTVTLTVTPDEGYTVDEINVEGAEYDAQSNTFTLGEQDVTVTVTFKLYQAEWGTGQDHLTEKGSLREALDAAAADDSVTYIKLVESITDRDVAMLVSSGTFTFDLGGRTLTSSNSIALVLSEGVSVTLTDTVGGGQLLATYYATAILMEPNSRLTVSQGSFRISGDSSDIHMKEGAVLRLTDYENVDGLCLYSDAQEAHVGMHVVLPDGYSVYQEEGGDAVAALQNGAKHTVDLTRYSISWEISGAYLNATPGVEWIAHGTTVTFTIEPYDYHEIVSVSINDGEVEYILDPDTGIYSFEMPMQDVCVTAQIKHNAFTWGESADTMTQTGDFYDLALAMNASDKTLYAKLLDDVYVILPQQGVTVNGKVVIALNYHSFEAFFESVIVLAQGADVTFFEDVEPDDPILLREGENLRVSAVFELQEGASLTFDGARTTASVLYRGGELDISGAHWASSVDLYNATEGDVLISDFVTLGERFHAIDYEALYESSVYTTIPKKEKMEKEDDASLAAIFTGSFDFGEGSGTATSVELLFQEEFRIPKFENVSHPEGLVLNGWRYESDLNAQTSDRYFYMTALADVTFEAVWGAPVYVGGVGLFDGDYLKAGATETTKVRPAAGGYAYFKDGVLTLKDYTFQGQGSVFEVYEDDGEIYESYALILASEDVIIELVGENKLTNGYDDYSYGIYGSGTVTIRGEGSLWLDTNDDGVYAKHFVMESGTVTFISGDDAFIVDSLTVSGGTLISLSWYGVYRSQSVSITGGEFYVLSLDDGEGEVAVCTESFTMDGGLLVIKGEEGIVANYITVNGGRIEIEAENDAIRNNDDYYNGLPDDAFLTVNGGVISLHAEYEDGIDFVGAVTVSGGELSIEASYGVYVWGGALTVSGGEIYISGYDASIYVSGGGTVTISGGEVDLYGAAYADGESAIVISGATVYLSGDVIAQDDSTFTLGGKSTAVLIYGALPEGEAFVLNEQEIKRIFADGEYVYYEGIEYPHTWSEGYHYDDTYHWHVCLDENCPLEYFGIPVSQYEGAAFGEHTPTAGTTICSACGYGAPPPYTEIPSDAILLVGTHFLKDGDYLKADGTVVTEKPEGGYLHVFVDDSNEMPVGVITLHDFTFTHTGNSLLMPILNMQWGIQLEGESTL
ncbi:MAG: carbohydrate-binding domain-containing protein, partial [Clostridia bacterium]|nr:carbohydrate-binding domain-containing protein [Clostridia bacterium]